MPGRTDITPTPNEDGVSDGSNEPEQSLVFSFRVDPYVSALHSPAAMVCCKAGFASSQARVVCVCVCVCV